MKFSPNLTHNRIPVAYYSDIEGVTTVLTPITYYQGASVVGDGSKSRFLILHKSGINSSIVCECLHGKCNDDDACVCNKGYSGLACNTLTVGSGSGFGTRNIILVAVFPVLAIFTLLFFAGTLSFLQQLFLFHYLIFSAVQYTRYKQRRLIKDVADRQRSNISREDITLIQTIGT